MKTASIWGGSMMRNICERGFVDGGVGAGRSGCDERGGERAVRTWNGRLGQGAGKKISGCDMGTRPTKMG
jgi:hypothetical protein